MFNNTIQTRSNGVKKKPRRLWPFAVCCIILVFFFGYLKRNLQITSTSDKDLSTTMGVCIITLSLIVVFVFIRGIIVWFINFLSLCRHNPKKALLTIFLFFILGFFIALGTSGKNYIKMEENLPVIQSILTDATVAKLAGDALMSNNSLSNDSWVKIKNTAKVTSDSLNALQITSELGYYRKFAVLWSEQVSSAAINTATWNSLSDEPADFKLSLTKNKAKEYLKTSVEKITEIREFGDAAIKRNDRLTMRFIAAKLLIQKHWLNGILHSSNSFLDFAVIPLPSVLAFDIPEVGPGCPVYTSGPLKGQCIKSGQTQSTGTITQPTFFPTQPSKKTQNSESQTQTEQYPPYTYTSQVRKICFETYSKKSVCTAEVIGSLDMIQKSAQDYASGNENAQVEWTDAWKTAESQAGIEPSIPSAIGGHEIPSEGVITVGGMKIEYTPKVQDFVTACNSKGGVIGGEGTTKDRLPTTESGYTCEYKQGQIPCWDLLTYSGGRYMGGNNGCPTQNLVPQTTLPQKAKQETKTQVTKGFWDGDYEGNLTQNCGSGGNIERAVVVQNNKVQGIDGGYREIDSSGFVRIVTTPVTDEYQFKSSGNNKYVTGSSTFNLPDSNGNLCTSYFSGTRK